MMLTTDVGAARVALSSCAWDSMQKATDQLFRMFQGSSVLLEMNEFVGLFQNRYAGKFTTRMYVRMKFLRNVAKHLGNNVLMLLTGSVILHTLMNAILCREAFVMMSRKL